ncbi:MAG: DNA-processing protein DprA [Firmicutes bacterium]|nr:DNA-processing protein DprA [Bacillota bacterium]
MYSQEELMWLWLCRVEGIGPVKRASLLSHCGGIGGVWEADTGRLCECGLKPEEASALAESREMTRLEEQAKAWEEAGIRFLTAASEAFPESLADVRPGVGLLFYIGDVSLLKHSCLAIVGARYCSHYGSGTARYLARKLSQAGYTIVSGMAFGIDAFAHRGTLDAYGKTIAVLGCGVDQCYPPGNQMLYRQIAEQGLIISEYPPGMTSRPGFFPMRNRLIAGLSRAVIVVEAARRSGSLITADLAMDMNKPVFAVPGPINENTSEGTNRLIQQGAVLLQDWDDVVRELRDELAVQPEVHFEDETTQQVWERVGWVAVYPDTMMQHLKLPPQKVMQCLTQLEMSGYVERLQDGSYIRIQ